MKIEITSRARRRIELIDAWWRENRPGASSLFVEELAWAQRELILRPHLAPRYVSPGGTIFRRLLLPRTEQHVYYTVDGAAELVIVHAVWGARRGRVPKL